MASQGHTLRSGGARGADKAFEDGCDLVNEDLKQIYLPYRGFNKNESLLYGSSKAARAIAKAYHPNWKVLGDTARDFMGRNTYQILSKDLATPTDFVICWTLGGRSVGGTSQAIRIAEDYNIPVINFGNITLDEAQSRILKLLGKEQ